MHTTTTNSLSSRSSVDAAESTHSSAANRMLLCSFVDLVNISGKVPCLASGASLLSFSFFLRSIPQISLRMDFADEEF